MRVAFEYLGLDELIALALIENIASRRVMEKSGFVYERDLVHVGLPHVAYIRRRGRLTPGSEAGRESDT